MINITISVDASQLAGLDGFGKKALVPFAKALTFTAKDAQAALKAEVPGLFALRRDWVPKGIRIKPANGGHLEAQVGSVDKYMERHVVGAGREKAPDSALSIRRKRDSRGRLATGGILIKPYGSIGSAQIHTVVRRQLKRVESQKRKPFHIAAGGRVFVVRRATKARYPLDTLAILQSGATIDEQWNMLATVSGVVSARFEGHFFRAMARAG